MPARAGISVGVGVRLVSATSLVALLVAGCTGDTAVPIEDFTDTSITTPHLIEPSEQMRELAEQQCLDDPDLAEGVVNAVDPANPDQLLASVVVDCDDVTG